jgi:hypothetical protein
MCATPQGFMQRREWLSPTKRQELIDEERGKLQRALASAENRPALTASASAAYPASEERKVCSAGSAALTVWWCTGADDGAQITSGLGLQLSQQLDWQALDLGCITSGVGRHYIWAWHALDLLWD